MLQRCPHCGQPLSKPLIDGLTSCLNCNYVFDSCIKNRLLSGAWEILKSTPLDLERLKFVSKLKQDEAIIVHTFMVEYGYSLDEFKQVLKLFD